MVDNNYMQDIIDPNNPRGPKVKAIIPHWLILKYYKFHPVRYENLRATKHVLENPLRIFTGVRIYNEGGLCFVGRPNQWYIREATQVPFPQDLIFAVYMNPRFHVYECRAEHAASDDPSSPENWQNRYGGLIWRNTS